MPALSWSDCTPAQRDAYRQAYLAAMHIQAVAEDKYSTLLDNVLGSGSPLEADYNDKLNDATNTIALMKSDYAEWLNDGYAVAPPDDPQIARIQAAATALGAVIATDENETAIANAITAGMNLFADLRAP